MRKLVAVAALCLLTGCGHYARNGYAAVAPGVSSPGGGAAEAAEGSAFPADGVLDDTQALEYVRGRLALLAPEIRYRLGGEGDVYDRTMSMAEGLLREGVAVSFGVRTRGDDVLLVPSYADNELLLRAHRSPEIRKRLTSDQLVVLNRVEQLVAHAKARHSTEYDIALELHDYLLRHASYVDETNGHSSCDVTVDILLKGKGVCDAYTRAYRLMLGIAGIENIFVAGMAQNENHCWNLVRLDGHWVHVDCTYSDPTPDEAERVFHTHFAMPDFLLARDHTWDRSLYPAATSTSLYYPFRYAAFHTVDDLVAWCRAHRQQLGSQYVTVYVAELAQAVPDKARVQALFERAHERIGDHVIAAYALEEYLPGVLACRCLSPQ